MYSNEFGESKTCSEPKTFHHKKEKAYKELFNELSEEMCKYTFELKDLNFILQYPKLAKFKKNLYPALDNLLKQCDMIKDDKLKLSKIKMVYNWFMNKKKSYFDLENIYKHSVKQPYQKIESHRDNLTTVYQAGNIQQLTLKEHRSDVKESELPKTKLKEYKVKKILPPIRNEEEINNINSINTKENNIEAATKSILNILSPKNSSTQASRYNTHYDSSSFKDVKNVRRVSVHKSSKMSKTEIGSLEINNERIKVKNKIISEKRSLSEINAFMDEWAVSKSKLIEEVQRKKEMNFLLKNVDIHGVIKEEKNDSDIVHLSNGKIKENNKEKPNSNNKRVSMKKVRNLINNKLISKKLKVKKIKINSKNNSFSPEKKDKILNENIQNFQKLPSEMLTDVAANIKSLETRMLYEDAISPKEKANRKKVKYVSIDPIYFHESPEKTQDIDNKYKRSISVNFKEYAPEKNNMLLQCKALNTFTTFEVLRLKTDLSKENITIPITTMKRAFISPETKVYPKHFLPKTGFGLMSNPLLQ